MVNVYSNGNINGFNDVGGIAGYIEKSSIKESYSIGNINGNNNVSGIAGSAYGGNNIMNSYSMGNVNGYIGVGGVVGRIASGRVAGHFYNKSMMGNITNSYSIGNINGSYNVGGIAGSIEYGSITNSYSVGNVSGREYIGGITGYVSEADIKNNAVINHSLTNTGLTSRKNRVIGYIYIAGDISNNFATSILHNFEYDNECSGIGKDDDVFFNKDTYKIDLGWKFGDDNVNPWKIDINKNGGYPYFYWQD